MNNQLVFVIEKGEQQSNSQFLLDCTLASLYIPSDIQGKVLTLQGSLDGCHYYLLDYRLDLTKPANKGVMVTNLQNHCCGLRAVKLMSDSAQTGTITLLGGVLC